MDYPIWAISGRFCGKVYDDQVYDENGKHVGYIDDARIYSARTGRVVGEFYRDDRVGVKSNRTYSIRGIRGIRGSKGFGKRGSKGSISPAGWTDPHF
ncbi:MAG: hypothetical protein K6T94_22600 [Paenibacillus sp.]|nr:hypothetical protein [Paenibacillus sp.]